MGVTALKMSELNVTLGFFDSELEVYKTEKPYVCLVPLTHAPKGFQQTNIEYVTHDVVARDIRGFEDEFDIDTHGFTLVKHQTSFTDWHDGKKVVREYYQHIRDLLNSTLGAREVHIFDHTIRLGDHVGTPQRQREIQGLPSQVAHVDHTLVSTQQEIKNDFGHKADELLASRHQIINVWHPIIRPIEQQPLTLCDYRTAKDDAFPADLVYPHLASENRLIGHSKTQQWYFMNQQRLEEAWMFKISDSEAESRTDMSRFCAHTSFSVPGAKADAHPRESIEFRAYVFY